MTSKESIPLSLHVLAVGVLPTPYKAGAARLLLPYASPDILKDGELTHMSAFCFPKIP